MSADSTDEVYESLVAYGAPLAAWRAHAHLSFEQTLVAALPLARRDSTVMRVLPLVVLQNEARADWGRLVEDATRLGVAAELGLVLDLAARAGDRPELGQRARTLASEAVPEPQFFFEPRNAFDRELARRRSPETARRWGFFLNMDEATFRAVCEKHA